MKTASNNTKLAMLAAGLGTATAAGFGLAMGKDVYRNTKKNLAVFAVLSAMVLGPFFGGRGLVRGHDRGWTATIFLTVLGSLFLIVIGFFGALIFMYFASMFLEVTKEGALPIIVFGAGFLTLLFTAIGIIVGLVQRPKRLRAISVSKENARYLSTNGFTETDGSDITHYDPDGHPLRFIEAHSDRLVFMAVGRRGKRPSIQLDSNGRMVGYSGIA